MKNCITLTVTLAILSILVFPSLASACNSAQPVTVSVTTAAPDSVTAGNAQGYSYNVGACSTPDHVTLEWVKILDPNAKFDRDPAARQTMTGEISQGSRMTGSGSWTVPPTATTGAYAVMVRYYANYGGGLIVNEANAAVKFNVNAAPAPAPDVCANIAGVQTTVPAGMIQSGSDCITPPAPAIDVCANIAGVQTTVPAGMMQSGSDCIVPPQPVDVCANIAGAQPTVPDGLILVGLDCVTPPVDMCANIAGVQPTVPAGLMLLGSDCIVPPADLCANIAGMQTTIPSGMILAGTDCVTPETDVCPNISGMQTAVPTGMTLTPTGQCTIQATPQGDPLTPVLRLTKIASAKVVKNGQVFVYTIRLRNVGTGPALKVLVCDTIPAHLTVVRAAGAKYSQGRVCWTMDRMNKGGSKTFKISVRVDQNTPRSVKRIKNTATAQANNHRKISASVTVSLKHKPVAQPTGGVTG